MCSRAEGEAQSWAPSHTEGIHQACLVHTGGWSLPTHSFLKPSLARLQLEKCLQDQSSWQRVSWFVSVGMISFHCLTALGLSGKV